ncbi:MULTISPECIES: Hsp20/alpha crystallin family protein [unclassified Kaistella]|uniref:Hsp20/alpha crystallin family protein n=1 Tax=unclassified Kaistella TaxID=2762626 RepID=UPI002735FB56|nr:MULTISPECIES: Hsp20 family protein [unclassified Kaistella]MDP2453388.1 Hsp20 family protein [Kaistella sp. SH11-4b]MDP2456445.1 Hsp20 family protein [Kaistella sp. SH40-3]MDP2459201.1 Hsp20 family protein [Kaistella sp. SH19-2b]
MNNLSRRNSFFDDFFTKDLMDFNRRPFAEDSLTIPSVNVKEEENGFEIQVAAPGIKKQDFKINLDRNVLSISSENKSENEEVDKDGKFTRREFNYSSFSRSFTLPEMVETDKIEATYEDGILKVSVPKKEIQSPILKTIEIK